MEKREWKAVEEKSTNEDDSKCES